MSSHPEAFGRSALGVVWVVCPRRGEKNSDVDLFVELPSRASLFDLIQLRQDLEEKLGRKVDVVSYRSVSPRLKPYVMKDVVRTL